MPNFKFDHIHLVSPEPEKTAQFYAQMFGAEITRIGEIPEGGAFVFLTLHGIKITVSNPRGPQPANSLEHWGIATDDIERAVADLKAAGVLFQMDIIQFMPGVKIAFFWAPDNVLVELIEDKT